MHTQQQQPDDMHAISRHRAPGEVGCILKVSRVSRQDDVAQERDLGMERGRAVDGVR